MQATELINRHQVYEAFSKIDDILVLEGLKLLGYGNACDRTNNGQYKFAHYQSIAKLYHDGNIEEAVECARKYAHKQ